MSTYFPSNMSAEDQNKYYNNKVIYERATDKNSPEAVAANAENNAIRQKYGISGDTMNADQFALGMAYSPNQYHIQADKYLSDLDRYGTYNDPYKQQIDNLYRRISNFSYDPSTDPVYKAYSDMYAREGEAAQHQTLSDLTSLSGGRNNSWASVATAQVGQQYAQKAADMIPQLAQTAYERLLNQFNLAQGMSDSAYGRWNDSFNNNMALSNLFNERGDTERQNNAQQMLNARDFRSQDIEDQTNLHNLNMSQKWDDLNYGLDYNIKNSDYQSDLKYRDPEREEALSGNIAENLTKWAEADAAPGYWKSVTEGQNLDNEEQRIINQYLPREKETDIAYRTAQTNKTNRY